MKKAIYYAVAFALVPMVANASALYGEFTMSREVSDIGVSGKQTGNFAIDLGQGIRVNVLTPARVFHVITKDGRTCQSYGLDFGDKPPNRQVSQLHMVLEALMKNDFSGLKDYFEIVDAGTDKGRTITFSRTLADNSWRLGKIVVSKPMLPDMDIELTGYTGDTARFDFGSVSTTPREGALYRISCDN